METTKIDFNNEEELKKKLTEEEYRVLREGKTEMPYSGKYYEETKDGFYHCKVCDNRLFKSDMKYHSDTIGLRGWPSFDKALPGATEERDDTSMEMHRTEIVCARCKSHLGHIFPDSDSKTGAHYCINSVCLDLKDGE